VAKCVWIIIEGKGLWSRVVTHKYIESLSLDDWIISPTKSYNNSSIIWKVVVLAFPLIGNWPIWKVGVGNKVRLREYL
jgi:hypothetical protein